MSRTSHLLFSYSISSAAGATFICVAFLAGSLIFTSSFDRFAHLSELAIAAIIPLTLVAIVFAAPSAAITIVASELLRVSSPLYFAVSGMANATLAFVLFNIFFSGSAPALSFSSELNFADDSMDGIRTATALLSAGIISGLVYWRLAIRDADLNAER